VHRVGSAARAANEARAALGGRALLFHGSGVGNLVSILKDGLKVRHTTSHGAFKFPVHNNELLLGNPCL